MVDSRELLLTHRQLCSQDLSLQAQKQHVVSPFLSPHHLEHNSLLCWYNMGFLHSTHLSAAPAI